MPTHITVPELTSSYFPTLNATWFNTADDGFGAGFRAVDSRRKSPFNLELQTGLKAVVDPDGRIVQHGLVDHRNAFSYNGTAWATSSANAFRPYTGGGVFVRGVDGTYIWFDGSNQGESVRFDSLGVGTGSTGWETGAIQFRYGVFFGVVTQAALASGSDTYIIGGRAPSFYGGGSNLFLCNMNLQNPTSISNGRLKFEMGTAAVTVADGAAKTEFFTTAITSGTAPLFFFYSPESGSSYVTNAQTYNTVPMISGYVPYDVTVVSGNIYTVGFNPTTSASYAVRSTNAGATWTSASIDTPFATNIVYHAGEFYAFGYDPILANAYYCTSADAITWSTASSVGDPGNSPISTISLSDKLWMFGSTSYMAHLSGGQWYYPMTRAALEFIANDGTHVSSSLTAHQNLDVVGQVNVSGAFWMDVNANQARFDGGQGAALPEWSGTIPIERAITVLDNYGLSVISPYESRVELQSFPWNKGSVDIKASEGYSGSISSDTTSYGEVRVRLRAGWDDNGDIGVDTRVYGTLHPDFPRSIVEDVTVPMTINYVSGVLNNGAVTFASATNFDRVIHLTAFSNSSPTNGDLWYDGTNLKFRSGSTTRTLSWT